jgi:hypothetical protein
MSLTGFHPLRDKILPQTLQVVADQGCNLEGSSPCEGTAYRGVYCIEASYLYWYRGIVLVLESRVRSEVMKGTCNGIGGELIIRTCNGIEGEVIIRTCNGIEGEVVIRTWRRAR